MAALKEVDKSSIPKIVAALRKTFNSGKTQSKEFRVEQLRNLLRMLEEKQDVILKAGNDDLGKNRVEMMFTEFLTIKSDIITTIKCLDSWMKPQYVPKDMLNLMNSLYIKPEPLGVLCVFSAWNYPVELLLHPLIAGIASGNTVLLKPSDLAINTSNMFLQLIPQYLDKDCYAVVTGGVPVAQAVLKERFDHILYTGNSEVGKIIMRAASEYLTPVTLELGGSNPCYVDSTANLKVAAKRIAWGKFMNLGQTCLAPNYILCDGSIRDKLVGYLKEALKEYYGEDPKQSKDYGRIINERHFDRVAGLLKGAGTVLVGGDMDRDSLYIAPTIITDVAADEAILKDEIFGPLLPIITVDSVDEAIAMINAREKPLAVYAFTSSKQVQKEFSARTSSGALSCNDVCVHFAVNTLPFGGVGMSGHGAYHGKFGFDTFSHKKAHYIASTMNESLLKVRYPPLTDRKLKIASSLIIPSEKSYGGTITRLVLVCIAAIAITFTLRVLGYSFF